MLGSAVAKLVIQLVFSFSGQGALWILLDCHDAKGIDFSGQRPQLQGLLLHFNQTSTGPENRAPFKIAFACWHEWHMNQLFPLNHLGARASIAKGVNLVKGFLDNRHHASIRIALKHPLIHRLRHDGQGYLRDKVGSDRPLWHRQLALNGCDLAKVKATDHAELKDISDPIRPHPVKACVSP